MSKLAPHTEEIISLRQQKKSLQEIADRFGCSREAIRLVLKANGVTPIDVAVENAVGPYRRWFYAVALAARLQDHLDKGGELSPTGKRLAFHGTRSRYMSGCSCDECREANRLAHRELIGRKPFTHGVSGYSNYRCRCAVCAKAWSDWTRLHPEYKQRWLEKVAKPCVRCGEKTFTPPDKVNTGLCQKCERSTRKNRRLTKSSGHATMKEKPITTSQNGR